MRRLRILSWNVNGLRACERKGFHDFLAAENPDILCLQETKAHPDQLPRSLREIPRRHAFFHSADRKGYSGVATYSQPQPLAAVSGLGIGRFDAEGRVLRTDYPEFLLFNIYFPNGQKNEERLAYKLEFYDAFLDHAEALVRQGRRLVIAGDYNTAHTEIDLARPKENEKISGFLPVERAWMDRLVERGYVDTFRRFHPGPGHYTWWSALTKGARERNVGWRIDYHFVSANLAERVVGAEILPQVMGSDHCPIGVTLEF